MTSNRAKEQTGASADLRVSDLDVRFGDFKALEGIAIEVWPGEIVGVIGPNGAGKSTLVNALTGVVAPTAGTIELCGRALQRERPNARAKLGLLRTFQTAELFGSLSVNDNISLGIRRAVAERGRDAARIAIERLGVGPLVGLKADDLSGGERKLVELVRSVAGVPDLLLLDEPVAGVPVHDRQRVIELLRDHIARTGASTLLIEHDMEFISGICDWIYVMAAGEIIASGPWSAISTNEVVLEAYLGSSV